MKTLPVDLDELALALEGNDPGYDLGAYWFDTSTGDVLFVSSDLEEDEELRDQIAEDAPGRFVRVNAIDSRTAFRMMEDFVGTLPAGRARDTLESSLGGPRPFGQFKDSLTDKKVRERWFAFRHEAVRRSAIAWLAELGIRAEGVEDSESGGAGLNAVEAENDERTFDGASEVSLEEQEIDDEESDEEIDAEDPLELPISDEEEDELAGFVESASNGRFDFPKFHGLVTALAIGPVLPSPSEIIQVLLQKSDAAQRISSDFWHSERILELIARLQNEILSDIDAEMFEPESFEREHLSGESYPDTFSWCEGFVLGINHNGLLWEKWYSDSRRKKAISAIEAAGSREFRSGGVYFETPEKMWALYDVIERLIPLIRYFWLVELGLDELTGAGSSSDE
jgi:yecA family protein